MPERSTDRFSPYRYDEVHSWIDALSTERAVLVAVDGCGGSGKSTFTRALATGWPRATVVELDDFYRPSRDHARFDGVIGGLFDLERLRAQVLAPAREGRTGRYQRYDWDRDTLADWQPVPASGVVIIEGVYSTSGGLRGLYDVRFWVECPEAVRLTRGLARDGEGMRKTWTDVWLPAESRYVETQRPAEAAHFIVDGSRSVKEARAAFLGARVQALLLRPPD